MSIYKIFSNVSISLSNGENMFCIRVYFMLTNIEFLLFIQEVCKYEGVERGFVACELNALWVGNRKIYESLFQLIFSFLERGWKLNC